MPGWMLLFTAMAAIGTWLARRYALQASLLDQPGERRSHVVATPRGGGIAIVLTVLVAVVALAWRDPSQRVLLAAFGVGFAAIAAVGWVDDHRPLSARLRLVVHVGAAFLFSTTLGAVTGHGWWAALGFVLIVGLTNVWNFMDGIDGLATTQAVLLACALMLVAVGAWGGLSAALLAGCVGFLPFNWPRARIFLGDVGSGSIGFAIGALVLVASMRWLPSHPAGAALWLLPLSAFLVDTGLTLARRIARGERWWTAHVQHAYQGWARRIGHPRVTAIYAAWTLVALILAWILQDARPLFILATVLAWYTAAGFAWLVLQKHSASGSRDAALMKDS